MRRNVRAAVLLLFLLSLGTLTAFGQFLSGIEGTVSDSSGASVPGARVTLTNDRLQVTKTTTTNDAGYFRIDSIAASTYTVKVEASGFKSWSQQDLDIAAGQLRTIAPVMQVGSVSDEITVTGTGAVAVNLATPGTTAVIPEQTVEETPLTGQNVYALASLTPGVTGAAVTSASTDNFTNEYAVNINAAGLRQEQNGYAIDGAQTNTPSRGGGTSISPNPAIVQSMEVRTNDFDAQKGRNGGAVVDVYTKSGTNQYHGNVDYYFTNDLLSAETHFVDRANLPNFKRNEVSATIGGPAIKNKLFWFGAIDVLRSSVASSGSATVETQDFYNWVQTNMPNTMAYQALTMAPPVVYASANSPGVQTVAQITGSHFPTPSGIPPNLDAFGNVNYSNVSPKNGYQWSFRGDYYQSEKDRFYVDAIRTSVDQGSVSARPAFNAPQKFHSTFINVNWTHAFGSHWLNEVGANVIRPYGQNGASPAFAVPNINVTGIQGFGNWGPGNFTQTTVGWRDVATAMIKSHTLKFGFEQLNIREVDKQGGAFDRPTYNFNSLLDFIQDGALTESGTPVNLLTHQEAPYDRRYRELYTGFFVQDNWKARPTFTVNAGLRYDQMNNLFSIISPTLSRFNLGPGSTYFQQVANGTVGLAGTSHVLHHNPWGLTPRVGFSWDVFGKGNTAVRGGFGMFSDQPPYLHMTDMSAGNLPNFFSPSLDVRNGDTINFQFCQPPQGFSISCPVLPTNNAIVDPNTGALYVNGVLNRAHLGGWSPNYKMTQVLAWTFSVQQQLQKDLVLELNYSATAAHHLPIFNQDSNRFAGDLIVNNGTFTRLNPNFGTIELATSDGNSIGHFGSATLTRRFTHGLAFRGIYTYGKALDALSTALTLDAGQSSNGFSNIVENGNLKFQRGRSDFDIRQQFALEFNWTTPRTGSALERNALGGWTFNGIWLLETGLPFWVYTTQGFVPVWNDPNNCPGAAGCQIIGNSGGDYNADGAGWDSPNAPSFGSHLSGQSKSKYLNGLFPASAFPAPALGQEGNLGRNTYDNEGYNNFNFTIGKAFSAPWFFGEKIQLEGRGEFYNLFNRSNLAFVNGDLSNGSFGRATQQLPARRIQLHLRATF